MMKIPLYSVRNTRTFLDSCLNSSLFYNNVSRVIQAKNACVSIIEMLHIGIDFRLGHVLSVFIRTQCDF